MESIGLFKLAELHNSWLAARQVTVASNVANVDTPGYRSIDVKSFASVMSEIGDEAAARARLSGASGSLLGASDIRQLNPDWGTKLSGNTVSVEQEHEIRFYIAGCESAGRRGIVRTNSQFTGCQIPDITNPSLGGSTPWSIDSFINVYVADLEACGLSGFSTQCDSLSEESSIIVIDYRFLGRNNMEGLDRGFTLVHELGHYFGLSHPWGNDLDGCISDDGIEDTPNQSGPYYGCPSFPQRSCGSSDYYFTFMDYVDDSCMELFTPGQINKMIATLESKYPFLRTNKVNCDIDYARYNFCDLVDLYPNPVSNGFLHINIPENLHNHNHIQAVNANGKFIKLSIEVIDEVIRLNVNNLNGGLYFFMIGDTCTKKVLVHSE